MSLIDDRLEVGSVVYEFVTDTTPPKNKYYIIVGITNDIIALGAVYINTEINPNVFRTERLRTLHIPILKENNPFLDYDSFIDCSEIHPKLYVDVERCITSDDKKYGYVATISKELMDKIIATLYHAFTISKIDKDKFNISID